MKLDMRDIIRNHIINISKSDNVYVIAVDSAVSSKLQSLKEELADHFIDVGVAEQNAFNIAAGISYEGAKVFVFGISTFLMYRAYEQLRSIICENKIHVIFIGLWCGLYYSDQGYTHLQIDDLNATRSLPNLRIFSPYDNNSLINSLDQAISYNGPSYIRIENPLESSDYLEDDFKIEDMNYNSAQDNNLIVISTGQSVNRCIKAIKFIENETGYKIPILPIYELTFTKFGNSIVNSIKHYNNVLVVEEHYDFCGLGASIILSLAFAKEKINVNCLGVNKPLNSNQTYKRALEYHSLNSDGIIDQCYKILEI